MLLVLPSALDDYGKEYGVDAERDLSQAMFAAMEEFEGPVYVLDQPGPLRRPSKILSAFGRAIRLMSLRKEIRSLTFSTLSEWTEVVAQTKRRLMNDGINELVLGGVWFDPNEEVGPTTEIYKGLSKDIEVDVLQSIVGYIATGQHE